MQDVPEHAVLSSRSPERRAEVQAANGHLTPPSTPPLSEPTSAKDAGQSPPPVSLPEKAATPPTSAGVEQTFPDNSADSTKHHAADSDNEADISDASNSDADDATEEPIIQSIQTIQPIQAQQSPQKPQTVSLNKARIVTVPKRVPPKLPERNPNRGSGRGPLVIGGSPTSPARSSGEGEVGSLAALEGASGGVSPPAVEGASVDEAVKGLRDVKLDDDADDEPHINGWAKARASREEERRRTSGMPGGFD